MAGGGFTIPSFVSMILLNLPKSSIQSVEWAVYPNSNYDPSGRSVIATNNSNYISIVPILSIVLTPTNDIYAEAVVTLTSGQTSTYRKYLGNIGSPSEFSQDLPVIPFPSLERNFFTNALTLRDLNGSLDYYYTNNLVQSTDWMVVPEDSGNDFVFQDTIYVENDTALTSSTISIPAGAFPNVTNLTSAFTYYRLVLNNGKIYTFSTYNIVNNTFGFGV